MTEAHRVGYDGVTELNRTELLCEVSFSNIYDGSVNHTIIHPFWISKCVELIF